MTVLLSATRLPRTLALPKEIPHATKHRLELDVERSWIVLTEANRFAWPGPDLRQTQPGDLASVAYRTFVRHQDAAQEACVFRLLSNALGFAAGCFALRFYERLGLVVAMKAGRQFPWRLVRVCQLRHNSQQ